MNILHICSLDNNMASGVSVIVPQYAENHARMHRVVLYNINQVKCQPIKDVVIADFQESVLRLTEEYEVDIAVFHGIYFLPYIIIARKLRKRKIPYVVVPHGSLRVEAQSQKKLPKSILNHLFYNDMIRHAVALQFLSVEEKAASKSFQNAHKIILPNGVPERKEKWIPHERDCFKMVFVGRYSIYHKGLDRLAEACFEIRQQMLEKKIRIHLYGIDFENNLEKLEKYVKEKKLENVIEINGPVYGEDKMKVLLEADCFIQTSRSEGQPVGILEAMSIGLVPIVTQGTTFAKIVRQNQCGFDAGSSVSSIAETILRAYDSKKHLESMSLRARQLIEELYSWSTVTRKTTELYQEILNNGTSHKRG